MATKKKAAKKPSKFVNLKLTPEEASRLMTLCVSVFIPKNGEGRIQCITLVPTEAAQGGMFNTIDYIVTKKLGNLGVETRW